MCWRAEAEMYWVVAESKGEVGRLGVRRQETGEQGSPSECRKDKKESEGKPYITSQRKTGKEVGWVWVMLRGHTKHSTKIVGSVSER